MRIYVALKFQATKICKTITQPTKNYSKTMKAKINLLLGALLLTTLFSACNPTYRVVEDPIYECASCDLFDFRRIELTDSATIINLDVCFTPKYWIKFDKNLTLMVGDERYKILSIEKLNIALLN